MNNVVCQEITGNCRLLICDACLLLCFLSLAFYLFQSPKVYFFMASFSWKLRSKRSG